MQLIKKKTEEVYRSERRKIKPKIQYRSRSLHTWIREENFDSASAGF
jgi:hypothetical protein